MIYSAFEHKTLQRSRKIFIVPTFNSDPMKNFTRTMIYSAIEQETLQAQQTMLLLFRQTGIRAESGSCRPRITMAAVSALCCSICLDESEEIAFHCSNRACAYCLRSPCFRSAFDDYSGTNSSNCQLCGIPSAMDMITAICGAGAISAVEKNQVFSRV